MKFHMIILAAGFGSRFGSNKLIVPLEGKPLYQYVLDKVTATKKKRNDISDIVIVTQYDEIECEAEQRHLKCVRNIHSEDGISSSMKLGLLEASKEDGLHLDNYVFFVADQPNLQIDTVDSFLEAFLAADCGIGCVRSGDRPGNPVIFAGRYVDRLLELKGDTGGKQLIRRYPEDVFFYEIDIDEAEDIDTPSDIN